MFTSALTCKTRVASFRIVRKMATIVDGSVMEGGGQIIRSTIAYSCLLNKPVSIKKIRANRANPGLRAQHLTGILLVKDLCEGDAQNAKIGSSDITFSPGKMRTGSFLADIRSAGSVALLMQVSLPCLIFGPGAGPITLKGGTNADMAPQIDYVTDVFLPTIKKMGADIDLRISKRGYYPKGGGEVVLSKVNPVYELKPINLLERGDVIRIEGRAFTAGGVKQSVSSQMAAAAKKVLKKQYGSTCSINIETVHETPQNAFGDGCGLIITAHTSTGCRLAASGLGARGITAAEDQLIMFMALAPGKSSIRTGPLSLHTQTVIHISQLMCGAKFDVRKAEEDATSFVIECEGIGFRNPHLDAAAHLQ
eukprot:Colp12_sorted_trinity150504_noHs@12049